MLDKVKAPVVQNHAGEVRLYLSVDECEHQAVAVRSRSVFLFLL